MRKSVAERNTVETQIAVLLELDRRPEYIISSQIKFLKHMLECFARSGLFTLEIDITGDLEVDQHHTLEDCGLMLGKAFKIALGDKKGISRAGYFVYPMEDSLAVVAVDISGRPYLKFDAKFKRRYCGDLDTDTLEDFFYGFSVGLQCNIAVIMPYGRSDHHKIEAIFKAFGKAMKMACTIDRRAKDQIPSTKGVIDDSNN